MARESGYIQPDMTLTRAEIAAERKAWDDAIREAIAAERERCARMVEHLRSQWFHDGVPGDLAVPAGAFARSMTQLAAVMRDPNVNRVETD